MNSNKLLLIGAGGHARACIEIIESTTAYSIAHVIGQKSELNMEILGYKIRYSDSDLDNLRKEYEFAFIAIGQIKNPNLRMRIWSDLLKLGYSLPAIISPNAIVSKHTKIGSGTIVMNSAIINANCRIGENSILNSGSIIEHDVFIGNNCHVSTGVIVNGGVTIGSGCFLGSGTIVREGIEIGENSFVGMGSIISKSLPANSIHKANH